MARQMREVAAAEAVDTRPNEDWWQRNGGLGWQKEVDARRSWQPHYAQQEAFLRNLFLGLPPVRALDFGCGYGRHLNYLRRIPGLQIHGCDMSPTMLEGAAVYLDDPAFVKERVHRIQPRARLPFPDGYFDVVFTSEVLIHVEAEDLKVLLSELWRVSSRMVFHIENRPVDASQRENDEHSGCWLHDFRGAYRELFGVEVDVMPDLIDRQCVYLAHRGEPALVPAARLLARDNRAMNRMEAALKAERDQSHLLRTRVQQLEETVAGHAAQEREAERRLTRRVVRRAERLLPDLLTRWDTGRGVHADPVPPPVPNLSFAGVATRASHPSPADFVAQQPATVGICHPDWRGIRAAAYGQVDHVLEVPEVVDERHAEKLTRFLLDCGTSRVVINGYPENIDLLPETLARLAPSIRTYFVYHGAPAAAAHEMHLLQRMLELSRERKVAKVGLVKDGLAEFFRQQGYRAEPVMNVARMPVQAITAPTPAAGTQIGIFSPAVLHKNVATQIMAALMVPDAVVHLCDEPPLAFLRQDDPRLRVHGILPHPQFMSLLSTMHASLYVSLVECYPMTVLESFFSGVLCLTSHTSVIFDRSPELFDALVVTAHDNPAAITRKLMAALERRQELVAKAQTYLIEQNALAERRFQEFLET